MAAEDPRRGRRAQTANEELLERIVIHLVRLTQLGTGETRKILDFLNREVLPDLTSKIETRVSRIIEAGFDAGPETTRRLTELRRAISSIVTNGTGEAREALITRLKELAENEAAWQLGVIKEIVPVKLDVLMPSVRTLQAVVTRAPLDGVPLRGWFDRLNRSTQNNLNREIRIGLVQGETVGQIMRRIRGTKALNFKDGVLALTRRQAEAIVRSAVIHTSSIAREELFKKNTEVIKGIQIVATLDTATCPICGGLDGQVFPVDKGPRPLFHVSCRCSTVPVLRSWKELGIDLKEAPPGTRASLNGEVPDTLTYGPWLRDQPKGIQIEALGRARAELFASGELKITRFTTRGRKTLTLKELRLREPDAFKSAGISVE